MLAVLKKKNPGKRSIYKSAHSLQERGLGQLSAWFLERGSSAAYLKVEEEKENCGQRSSKNRQNVESGELETW